MANRNEHQLDFDDIIYTQMVSEAEEKNKKKKRVHFELPESDNAKNSKRQRPRVSFELAMGNQPPTIGNQQQVNKKKKRRLR